MTHNAMTKSGIGNARKDSDQKDTADLRNSDEHDDIHLSDTIQHVTNTLKDKLHLSSIHASSPSKIFNPTRVHFQIKRHDDESAHDGTANQHRELSVVWKSRDNRKGRNSIVVPLSSPQETHGTWLRWKKKALQVLRNTITMFTTFPYWDMAFWSGWSYSCGSVLFVIDGAWAWVPLAFGSEFPGEAKYGVPLCFFFGACFYQIGATMAYFEAINDGSFAGTAMKRLLEGHEEHQKVLLDEKLHAFFYHIFPSSHSNSDDPEEKIDPVADWQAKDQPKRRSIAPSMRRKRRGGLDLGEPKEGEVSDYMTWRWWPTWRALRTHHIRDIGYIACTIQLFGATLYGITSVVILPGILDNLKFWQALGAYWVPQCVASICFLTAGILFTLETQEKWYKPTPDTVGWWIGAWATIGSVGFLLSAVFGTLSNEFTWCEYQNSLSSMWGSAAYLLSSLLQWYEAVNKGPVLAFPNNPNRHLRPADNNRNNHEEADGQMKSEGEKRKD